MKYQWLITLLPWMLVGCNWFDSKQESAYREYSERLSRALDVEAPLSPPEHIIDLPDKRELQRAIPRLSLGLLDSYELRKCGLFQLLAEKNSSLGKVQDPFRDMSYQLEVTKTLHACLEQKTSAKDSVDISSTLSDELIAQLRPLLSLKEQHLPIHLHNLLTTSSAMRQQLSSSQWLNEAQFAVTPNITLAIMQLKQLNDATESHTSHLSSWDLLAFQETLEKSELIGSLYYSLLRSTQWLEQTTNLLVEYDHKIICTPGRDNSRFSIINNVFNQFYIGNVQRYAAKIDQLYYSLAPSLDVLLESYQTPNYTYDIIQAHQLFRQANLEHVKYWQNMFKRCGVTLSR